MTAPIKKPKRLDETDKWDCWLRQQKKRGTLCDWLECVCELQSLLSPCTPRHLSWWTCPLRLEGVQY